jgi:LPS-assembly protein
VLNTKAWGRLALVGGFCLLPFGGVWGQTPESGRNQEPVELQAEEVRFDPQSGMYEALGDVQLRKGNETLFADRVEYHSETSDASALGHVRVESPEGVVTGEEFYLNLLSDTGLVRNGRLFFTETNFHVAGSELERLGKYQYRVQDGTFTTCDGEVPSWKFSAKRLDLTVGEYAWARHVRFYIHDIPVFYLPFFGYPIKVERESGLLMPNFGVSSKRGTEFSLAYYQVIDRHLDVTYYLDFLSNLGVGKGVEFRYFLGHDNQGEANVYHVNGFNGESDQSAIAWQHSGTLPGQVWLIADVEYASNRDFYDNFGEAAGDYNRDKDKSIVAASRNWEKNNLAGQVRYVRQYDDDNDLTLQRLPEVQFAMIRRRIAYSPFFYRLDADSAYLWQKDGLKGGRARVRPSLSASFNPWGWLEVGAEAGYLERLYSVSDSQQHQGVPDVSLRLGSRLSRVFALGGESGDKLQHVVQPEITYQYVPKVSQDHLPQFESADFIGNRNTLSLGVISRLTARSENAAGNASYHEYLYFRLAQNYDLKPSWHGPLEPKGQESRWSDLRAELILRPTRSSFVDLDTRYDFVGDRGLLLFGAEVGVSEHRGNRLSMSYRYGQDEFEYLAAGAAMTWLKPVFVSYEQRYSLDGSLTLENLLNIEYRAQCWSLFVTWRDRRDNQEIVFAVELSGLGRVGSYGSRLGKER